MISVIIPVYNQADKLKLCLESLATQTERDFEIIVVNDGSTDNPHSVVDRFIINNRRKVVYLEQENQGAPSARNHGRHEARGEYLLFSDADIIWQPEGLATLLQTLLANPNSAYAYSSFMWGSKLFKVGNCTFNKLQQGPCIHTAALMRAEVFPGFDEDLKKFQDWDLWLTIGEKNGRGIWIDQVLFQVATGGTMSSWLPSIAYRLLPMWPAVRRYQEALKIIKRKHNLL